MPENFSSLLEALNAEGRDLARPQPAGVIETLARGRRRRRRFTAGTSALAVVAVAAGVVLSTGGGARSAPKPVSPASTGGSAPVSTPAHQAAATKNREGKDALLLPAEAPQPNLYQWKVSGTRTIPTAYFTFVGCGFKDAAPDGKSLAKSETSADYLAAYDSSNGFEAVYHYASAADAQHDFAKLTPDPTCATAHVTAKTPNGYAWQDGEHDQESLHRMVVLSGNDIALWFYQSQGDTPYDTSGDRAALQRMTDRLDGATPVPDTTPLPPGTIPASAWLDGSQIPLATADKSVQGWVPLGGLQKSTSNGPAANTCEGITDGDGFVGGSGTTILTRLYHGSPDSTPVYPGSNYLYSDADLHIASFSDPGQAQTAFAQAKKVLTEQGCQFKDYDGKQDNRTIQAGTVTDTGFSLLATDKPGPTYNHLYCVIKGTHVSWMTINYEQGDTSTAGDAAVLAAMTARLP